MGIFRRFWSLLAGLAVCAAQLPASCTPAGCCIPQEGGPAGCCSGREGEDCGPSLESPDCCASCCEAERPLPLVGGSSSRDPSPACGVDAAPTSGRPEAAASVCSPVRSPPRASGPPIWLADCALLL